MHFNVDYLDSWLFIFVSLLADFCLLQTCGSHGVSFHNGLLIHIRWKNTPIKLRRFGKVFSSLHQSLLTSYAINWGVLLQAPAGDSNDHWHLWYE